MAPIANPSKRRSAQGEIRSSESEVNRDRLHGFQQEVLEAVATGWSLRDVAGLICRRAEELVPSVICSVLTVDATGHIRALAAPSLPEHYSQAVDGLAVGPVAGSCGTAAYRGEPVIVTDIATDPLWAEFKGFALPLGLRACWSSPIKGRNGKVTGTFAFYYPTPRGPDPLDREIVAVCVHLCAIAIDHEMVQSRIQKLAMCDPLTDLANRAHFQQYTCDLLRALPLADRALALLYIDLDDFKTVNDSLGHWFGDQLLIAVADRFRQNCRAGEFVARLGGDEFAVLQYPVQDGAEIEDLARRILACFDAPFDIEDHKIAISASIGIARAPQDCNNFVDLLKRSDMALYRAKRDGANSFCFFTAEMDRHLLTRRAMEEELRCAVAERQIKPYFQPIIDLATGAPKGFEALARWHHPQRGLILPGEFIGVAEHVGIIGTLGNSVLTEACAQAAQWPAPLKLAVNVSPSELARPGFAMDVVAILAASKLDPQRLEIEITESVRLIENAAMRKVLHDLKTLGVSIALDDFGTGYSALSYLQSFPFDKIKIDLSFIRDLGNAGPAKPIVAALIALARNLGMRTTAEGIESDWQRQWLSDHGCDEGQGYLFSRPIAAADVRSFLGGCPAPAMAQSA